MNIFAGLRRRHEADGRRRRPRRWTPEVTLLEGRTLQTINARLGFLKADPEVLAPTGRFVTIRVTGEIGSNQTNPPPGFFFVTDEYRAVEPHRGGIPLTFERTKGIWHIFSYSFTIQLEAKRSTRTFDGRHYALFVGVSDKNGTDGLTKIISVPKVFHGVTTPAPKPLPRARHGR